MGRKKQTRFKINIFLHLIAGEQNEKNKTEFISSLRDVCVHLIHSHDGARLTMQVIFRVLIGLLSIFEDQRLAHTFTKYFT